MYALRRVVAFSLDASIVWLVIVGLSRLGFASVGVNALVYLAYRGLGGGLLPATLGRWMLGLRLVSMSGGVVNVRQSLLREFPVALTLLGPVVGLFPGIAILFSLGPLLLAMDLAFVVSRTDRRSWRDVLAGTRVVDSSG